MGKKMLIVVLAMVCLTIFTGQALADWKAMDGYVQARSYAGEFDVWTKYTAGIKVWNPETGEFPDKNIVVIQLWMNGKQMPISFKENFHYTFFRNYDVNSATFPTKPYQEDRFWTGDIGTTPWECGKYTFKVWIGNDSYSEFSVYYVGPIYLPIPGKFLKKEVDDQGGMYVFFDVARGFPEPGVGMQVKIYAEAGYTSSSSSLVTVQDKIPGHMGMTYYPPALLKILRTYGTTGFRATIYTRANDNSARMYREDGSFWVAFP